MDSSVLNNRNTKIQATIPKWITLFRNTQITSTICIASFSTKEHINNQQNMYCAVLKVRRQIHYHYVYIAPFSIQEHTKYQRRICIAPFSIWEYTKQLLAEYILLRSQDNTPNIVSLYMYGQVDYDFWDFTQCRIVSKVFKDLNFEWNYTQLKFKPGTAEKNESTIGPTAGIEPTAFAMPVQCSCY